MRERIDEAKKRLAEAKKRLAHALHVWLCQHRQLVWAIHHDNHPPELWRYWIPGESDVTPTGVSCEGCGLYVQDVKATHG